MRLRHAITRAGNAFRSSSYATLALITVIALAASGCANSNPAVTGSVPSPAGQAIAFQSIDGPPKPVFDRLVSALTAEAEKRELPVVSHTAPAAWRIRAYLATHVEKKQATLSWVWEVFDGSQNRAFRLAGEEPLGSPGTDAWSQCDDALLRRIAAKGFDQLAARLAAPSPAPPPPEADPKPEGPVIAAAGSARPVAFAEPRR